MSIEEIYNLISQRLLQGVMTHQQLANYYDFLGLQGYKCCHEYHLNEQFCNYREFVSYYITHCNKLLLKQPVQSLISNPIIPDNWYNFVRQDVDINTRRNAVKNGVEKWVQWQKETKKVLEDMYIEFINNNQVGIAIELSKYIKNVTKEIQIAQQKLLKLKATDFDMPTIVAEQQHLKKKYESKMKKRKEKTEHD